MTGHDQAHGRGECICKYSESSHLVALVDAAKTYGWLLTINHSRLARRGGIKRISAGIYDETREVIRSRLEEVCAASRVPEAASNLLSTDIEAMRRSHGSENG